MVTLMTARVLALLGVAVALVTIGLCVPLYRGEIGMNRWYGIRLPWAFESEEMWFKVNRVGGRLGIVCGTVYGALMAGLAVVAPNSPSWIATLAWSPVAMAAVWLVLTVAATRNL